MLIIIIASFLFSESVTFYLLLFQDKLISQKTFQLFVPNCKSVLAYIILNFNYIYNKGNEKSNYHCNKFVCQFRVKLTAFTFFQLGNSIYLAHSVAVRPFMNHCLVGIDNMNNP